MRKAVCLALLGSFGVSAHSWLGCSDYRGDVSTYDDSRCFGYPRNWQQARGSAVGTGFQLGADTGYNYQPGAPCNLPRTNPMASAYTSSFPMAVYEAGQTYCLAWPTKNHVAASCTNQYIPDTTMVIYRSDVNPLVDPTQDGFKQNPVVNYFGVHQNGQIDCLGYQRSPRFCDNTDKALATGCIQAPSQPGNYTFQWYWVFNPGAPYTTCWDATVVPVGQGRGAGGLTGVASVVDNLTPSGDTCRTQWANLPGGGTTLPPGSLPPSDPPATNPAPGPQTTTPPVLTGDNLVITNAPRTVATSGTFTVAVDYSAMAAGRVLTVDFLNSSSAWFGKGETTLTTGAGTVVVNVEIYNPPTQGSGYIIRAWMITAQVYQSYIAGNNTQPWTEELARFDWPTSVATSTAYAQAAPSQSGGGTAAGESGSSHDSSMDSKGLVAGIVILTLLVFTLFGALMFALGKLKGTGK